ncbi:MAG: hypothetical protein PHW73_09000 [Atribacterota bacterium]|nr:hypothetical protein [Atribacterota bacterium]
MDKEFQKTVLRYIKKCKEISRIQVISEVSMKKLKQYLKAILKVILIVLIIAVWFYWFQWRPSEIRKQCDWEALYSASSYHPIDKQGELYDFTYISCLRTKGLEK